MEVRSYTFSDRSKAFFRGCFKGFHPLMEVAREGVSGRYALTERQGAAYGQRIAGQYLDIYPPNRAAIDHIVKKFSEFPPPVQKAALRSLAGKMGLLESMVIGAFCEEGSGAYRSWEKTREDVRELLNANAHIL